MRDSITLCAIFDVRAALYAPAKLSNEAVKCCKRDALRQTHHNI